MTRTRLGILLKNGDPNSGPGRYVQSLLRAVDPEEFQVVVFTRTPREFDTCANVAQVVNLDEPGCLTDHSTPADASSVMRQDSARAWVRSMVPFAARYSMGFTREAHRLEGLLRRCSIDVLHTNETGCEESAVAARLAGVPAVIGTLHVLPDVDGQRRRWIHRRLERRGLCALDLAIAVSEAGRAAWMRCTGVSPDRVAIIHNGIDYEKFTRRRPASVARRALGIPADDASIVVGSVARLAWVKGLEHLIEAVARLRMHGSNVRAVIAGGGPLLEELQGLAARLGAARCVHFVGHQTDIPATMEAFDVFAMPSLSEALPYAVMEAMSMQLPVIASNVGGIPEIVASEQTGILVPAECPEALAAGLRPLVESASLRERMGTAARRRVIECFDERRMTERTVNVYRSMVQEGKACA